MTLIVAFTLFALLMTRVLRGPRGSWRYVLGAGVAAALATQLLPAGHPLRVDVAESGQNLGWVALGLLPVAAYALLIRRLRQRAGMDPAAETEKSLTNNPLRGLVQISDDAILVEETEAALAGDAGRALGSVPRSRSLAWRAEGGEIAGHLRLTVLGNTCEIVALRVAEAHRGQGIGASLVRGAEEIAEELGATRIMLRAGSWQNLDFLRHVGLRVVREQSIGSGAAWVWMEKELT